MIGTLLGDELFATRMDSAVAVNSLDDLRGLTVATTPGSPPRKQRTQAFLSRVL